MILNVDLIRSRRRDLGLSKRRLAKSLGVTSPVVSSLEAGVNHSILSLGFLVDLAKGLAVSPSDLLLEEHSVPPEDLDLAGQLGSLLYHTNTLTPIESLSTSVGQPLDVVEDALDDLETGLTAVGLVLIGWPGRRRSGLTLGYRCPLSEPGSATTRRAVESGWSKPVFSVGSSMVTSMKPHSVTLIVLLSAGFATPNS